MKRRSLIRQQGGLTRCAWHGMRAARYLQKRHAACRAGIALPGKADSANNGADKSFNLFVLAVLEEALLEALARNGGFNQLGIDCAQGI